MSSTELGEFVINVTEGPPLDGSTIGVTGNMTTATATAHLLYCGKALDDFHTSYAKVHGMVCLLVCIFGSIANTLNIVVLTRREMRSPTNAILTGLAIADLLVMLDYMPYAVNSVPYLRLSREQRLTYGWAWYIMFHSIFAQICHTISIWLTVTLAIWRYIAVAYPQRNRQWCDMSKTLAAIFSSYVVCPFLAIPIYLSFSIQSNVELLGSDGNLLLRDTNDTGRNVTLFRLGTSQLVRDNPTLLNVNFWIYSVVFKLIPCIALTILSLRLIGALLEAKQRRSQLTGTATGMKQIVDGRVVDAAKGSKQSDKEKQTDRTTRMLLAVLLLFLITEFPQGILGLLSAVLDKSFFFNCYLKLGDVMDVLALVNSAINFILYCSMSRQFRSTFSDLFRPRILDRWMAVPQAEDGEGGEGGRGRHQDGATTQITQI
ncbi:G-protein coupled receptor dmsr-1-like isoform X3 [Anopheles darlingi]|uniref:G-protein coupled receptor dmsr-1-like isoform X2 n=1 Tax=Anopheles darlingi TaxID=43151 RepID=UPI0020FFF8EF|nr:G-protein coupled receptor dmsr-1-like isoform X2 [Anopheles darlingi]XP_049546667.1 G-protein coupled receptor dmsr-1-like isoform X3 [Anopheles darlingi]XP_049546668.1 G-protein coupled receptor dmsr-1-like isoform X3 [Anopheles darlingi]